MIVCLVCNDEKPDGSLRTASWCDGCNRVTSNRSVAEDTQRIHPASWMTYATQRELFETER